VGDPEVIGELPVLWDDADVVDGREPEWLDSGKQRGVVNEESDRGDFYREAGGDFVPGAILGAADSMDTNVLVGVLVVLVNARGIREDDCRRNILLIVEVRERRQGTW
jgi:hypothetical protein